MLEKQDLQAIKELIDTSENRIMTYIENAVMPNLKLLAEGHQTLLETLARKDRVESYCVLTGYNCVLSP